MSNRTALDTAIQRFPMLMSELREASARWSLDSAQFVSIAHGAVAERVDAIRGEFRRIMLVERR